MSDSEKILTLMKSLRQKISVRFTSLEYQVSKLPESRFYEYLVTKEAVKRIDLNGNIETVLKIAQHRAKCNYLFELESFINSRLEEKYKNLEEYYKDNGYEAIGFRLSYKHRKKNQRERKTKKNESVTVNLTLEQKEEFLKTIKKEKMSPSELCINALRQCGYLD